jgi:hypothetical protein
MWELLMVLVPAPGHFVTLLAWFAAGNLLVMMELLPGS